jgi:hypothetical protein
MSWAGCVGSLKGAGTRYMGLANFGGLKRSVGLGYGVGGFKGAARGFKHWAIGGTGRETAARLGTMAGAAWLLRGRDRNV